MNRQIILYAVIAAALSDVVEAQIRKPVDAPITFAQCGGRALFEYQVERLARFQADSALEYAPSDTSGNGQPIQLVVDSAGHAIRESLYMLTGTLSAERDQIAAWLPRWRFTPAMVGGRATCQVIQTFVRHRDRRTHH